MKLLHTADWHVGATLRGRSRAPEHRAVLGSLAEVARAEAVDLIAIAGDLFQHAVPSPEAEQIVYAALLELAATGAEVVVVSGNHDDPRRLRAVAPVFAKGNVTLLPSVAPPDDGGLYRFTTRAGERVELALVPFVPQRQIVHAADLMGERAAEVSLQYADRLGLVMRKLCASLSSDAVRLMVAHLTCVGATMGGGERMAHSIFEYVINAQQFPAALQYVALGHLHRAQQVAGPVPAWYSGSPLALDFGEVGDVKGALIVEATPSTPAIVRQVPLAGARPLVTLQGTCAELASRCDTTGDAFVKLVLTELPRPGQVAELREAFPDAVDVVIPQSPTGSSADRSDSRPRYGREPDELFRDYLVTVGASDERLVALFGELLDEAVSADAS